MPKIAERARTLFGHGEISAVSSPKLIPNTDLHLSVTVLPGPRTAALQV
jgi:hypothetical protein